MLATDRFLLISVGRTGTGGLHKWLQEVPGLRIISNLPHEPYRVMAAKCKEAGVAVPPAWTIIRNPFDYYVDKFCWERDKGPCFQGTFREFLQRTREQPTVEGYFYSLTQKWDGLEADKCDWVARFENYDEDVVAILGALIPNLITKADIRKYLARERHLGESFTKDGKLSLTLDHHDFYTDETQGWVQELDGELIERFGYSFRPMAGESQDV